MAAGPASILSPVEVAALARRTLLSEDAVASVLSALAAAGWTLSPGAEASASSSDASPAATARGLLKMGQPLQAFELLRRAVKDLPDNAELLQLQALALARSGASDSANALLRRLRAAGHRDEETLALLARTHKDLYLQTGGPDDLAAALEGYREAYRLSGGYWSAINAATLAACAGRREESQALAREVRADCARRLESAEKGSRYWLLATLGEASLLLGDDAAAGTWYQQASAVAGRAYGDLAATRRNARLILTALRRDDQVLTTWLPVPNVAVFAGHLMDQHGRVVPRLTESSIPALRDRLRGAVADLHIGIAYSAAASGADLLFLEAVLDAGGEANVVLPCAKKDFVEVSVEPAGPQWVERFDRVLARATSVTVVSEQRIANPAFSYDYASKIMTGHAALRAAQLSAEPLAIAVWDGEPSGPGSTAASVARWRETGLTVHVIPPSTLPAAANAHASRASVAVEQTSFNEQVAAVLFADAVGFSRLAEEEIPRFVQYFLGAVADVARSHEPPVIKNTWGDGLYFAFASVRAAGRFALALRDRIADVKWADHGLPPTLTLRIALHVGPVYACQNPVTDRPDYVGTHVSRAARIEPITPPGHVYASGAFAAFAASERIPDFAFEFVGNLPLAKAYGSLPMYHVIRRPRQIVI